MPRLNRKIQIPKPKKRGPAVPATRVISNPKKKASKVACRKKVEIPPDESADRE